MTSTFTLKACAALVSITLLGSAAPLSAAPAGGLDRSLETASHSANSLHQAQYRRQFEGRRYNSYAGNRYRRNSGRNLALGIGGLIIGGIVLSEAARSEHREEYSSDWQRCSDTYRSFEPETGMYTGYDGERHACPYLR